MSSLDHTRQVYATRLPSIDASHVDSRARVRAQRALNGPSPNYAKQQIADTIRIFGHLNNTRVTAR